MPKRVIRLKWISLDDVDLVFGDIVPIFLLIQIKEYKFCGLKFFLSNDKKIEIIENFLLLKCHAIFCLKFSD